MKKICLFVCLTTFFSLYSLAGTQRKTDPLLKIFNELKVGMARPAYRNGGAPSRKFWNHNNGEPAGPLLFFTIIHAARTAPPRPPVSGIPP